MNSPNPVPSNPSFYHHTSYSPPPLPNHTIINGHSLPLQFPFNSQISQPMNHQPSQPIYYPQSQPNNSYICLPTPQFQAQPSILPTKATTTPPIYQPSHVPPHDLLKPTETNLIDQVIYSRFSHASLQFEDTKVAASADKSSSRDERTAESGQDLSLVDDIGKVRHGGQHYEPEIVSATPLNVEPCLQMPDPKANGIAVESICGLTPSLAFTTSKGHTNIISEKTSSSLKEGTQGVSENAAEDSEAVNLDLSYKVTSTVVDKPLDDIFTKGCTKPLDILHRYDFLHDIATEEFSKEEFLHVFIALVYDCSKLYPFEARRGFLWNMLEPNFAAMIMSFRPLVNVNVGITNLPTGDRMVELKQNVGMLFERTWKPWKLKLQTETSLVDIIGMESDMKLFLHNFESLIHCYNRTASVQKDLVLANNSYTIQFHVELTVLALTALPLSLLIQKSLSYLDELLYGTLFESHYNILKFDRLAQNAIQNLNLSNVMAQGQAGMRLLVANFGLGLSTWLNGQLAVALASLVHDSLLWKCMKAITHYCLHVIVGIQVGSRLQFLQITEFWFNGDRHRNVLQRFMEFEIMILGKETTIELTFWQDAVMKNHRPYIPTLWSAEYQIVCSNLPIVSWHRKGVLPTQSSLSVQKKGILLTGKATFKEIRTVIGWVLCPLLDLRIVATLNAWLNGTLLCTLLGINWEKLSLSFACWFEKMEGHVNFFEYYMEPNEKCLGSVMLGVGVTVSIWDALQLFDEMQKWGLCLAVSVFGSFYKTNNHDGNQRDFSEPWSTVNVFFIKFPQSQVTAKVGRSVVTLLMMLTISNLSAKESGKYLDDPIHNCGFAVTIYLSIAFLDLLIFGFVDKYFDVLAAMLAMERLLRNIVTMFNHMLEVLRYMNGWDFLQTHFLMDNSHIGLNELLGKLRSKPNSQNLLDVFSAYASVYGVEEAITSVELMKSESQINSLDFKAVMANAIILFHLIEVVELTKGMAKLLRAFGIYTAFNHLANHPPSFGPQVSIEHFIDIVFIVPLHETIMGHWLGAYDEESNCQGTKRNNGRLINLFGFHHFCKMLQQYMCLQLIMRKLIWAELQVGLAGTLESIEIITRPVKMFNEASVHKATKIIRLVDKEDGSFHYCRRWDDFEVA